MMRDSPPTVVELGMLSSGTQEALQSFLGKGREGERSEAGMVNNEDSEQSSS